MKTPRTTALSLLLLACACNTRLDVTPRAAVELRPTLAPGTVREVGDRLHLTVVDAVFVDVDAHPAGHLSCTDMLGLGELDRAVISTDGEIELDASGAYRFGVPLPRFSGVVNPWGASLLITTADVVLPLGPLDYLTDRTHYGCTCVRLADADPPPDLAGGTELDQRIESECQLLAGPTTTVPVELARAMLPELVACGPDPTIIIVDGDPLPIVVPHPCMTCGGGACPPDPPRGRLAMARAVTRASPDPPWQLTYGGNPFTWLRVSGCEGTTLEVRAPGQATPVRLPVRCVPPLRLEEQSTLALPDFDLIDVAALPAGAAGSTAAAQQLGVLGQRGGRLELSWVQARGTELALVPQPIPGLSSEQRGLHLHGFVHPLQGPLLALVTADEAGVMELRVLRPPSPRAAGALVFTSSTTACVPEACDDSCAVTPLCTVEALGDAPVSLTSGDLDGDGVEDLALASGTGTTLLRWYGTRSSTVALRSDCRCSDHGRFLASVALADLGGPGPGDDLVVGDSTGVFVQAGSASGCLGCGGARALGNAPGAIVRGVARVSGSPLDDLLIGDSGVLACAPPVGAEAPQCRTILADASAVGDLDGDGRPEAIGEHLFHGGDERARQSVATPCGRPYLRRVADLDGDGRDDVIDVCTRILVWRRVT